MTKSIDCIVAGTCVLDILVRPVELTAPLGSDRLFEVEPIVTTSGGMVCNSGMALARLGCRTAALSCVGRDVWADSLRSGLEDAGIDTTGVVPLDGRVTSTTAVLISAAGERTFAHHPGAGAQLAVRHFQQHWPLVRQSRCLLLGYYSLLPELEPELPDLLAKVRQEGCLVAMDAGGTGGTMTHLEPILPHLDFYVPSRTEAEQQTGLRDPEKILRAFRQAGARCVVGLKLGADGALLSDADGQMIEVPVAQPPGEVVDTTGAGDAFYAGLLAGVLRGHALVEAAQLAAAAAACCVTAYGASAGLRDWQGTAAVAGWT